MAFKVVTDGQLRCIRQMARDKRIEKDLFEERGLGGGIISTALDAIKLGRGIRILPEILPPAGGRIYRVRVFVVLDREWQEAVNAAGPNTPDNYNVRKVDHLYPPTGAGMIESEMVLVNFGLQGGSLDRAIAWSQQYGLKQTDPRQIFAIGEKKPGLHRELNMNPMYVVATQDCTFEGYRQACCVWWDGAKRGADLSWVESFDYAHGWFAFASDWMAL